MRTDTITNHIRRHLDLPADRRPSLNELRQGQWCKLFEQLMRNRLIMGALRYETMNDKKHKGNAYDITGSIQQRITLYQESGNAEHLVDIANLCMIEFDAPSNPKAHFQAADDGVHTEKRTR